MTENETVRCRVAACRESLGDRKSWSFYLLNDRDAPLDSAVLHRVGYEWGDEGSSEDADVRVPDLAVGAHALIWRDDGRGAELRMDLWVRVCVSGREIPLLFEFPKLYRKSRLPLVAGLGKAGWEVTASG